MRHRGAIAQLGERLDRTQEVGGSSPPSSIGKRPANAGLSHSGRAKRIGRVATRRHRSTFVSAVLLTPIAVPQMLGT